MYISKEKNSSAIDHFVQGKHTNQRRHIEDDKELYQQTFLAWLTKSLAGNRLYVRSDISDYNTGLNGIFEFDISRNRFQNFQT
jgi:hypothetical protein